MKWLRYWTETVESHVFSRRAWMRPVASYTESGVRYWAPTLRNRSFSAQDKARQRFLCLVLVVEGKRRRYSNQHVVDESNVGVVAFLREQEAVLRVAFSYEPFFV